eukprot:6179297-Pleurochrysis_carterae.AAC.3
MCCLQYGGLIFYALNVLNDEGGLLLVDIGYLGKVNNPDGLPGLNYDRVPRIPGTRYVGDRSLGGERDRELRGVTISSKSKTVKVSGSEQETLTVPCGQLSAHGCVKVTGWHVVAYDSSHTLVYTHTTRDRSRRDRYLYSEGSAVDNGSVGESELLAPVFKYTTALDFLAFSEKLIPANAWMLAPVLTSLAQNSVSLSHTWTASVSWPPGLPVAACCLSGVCALNSPSPRPNAFSGELLPSN